MDGMMGMGWWMTVFTLLVIAVLVLVVVATIWLIRSMVAPARRLDTAEAVLRERYASGDLSREEFRQRVADLGERRR